MSIQYSKNILKDVTIGDVSGDFHVGDIIHLHFVDGTEQKVPLNVLKEQLKEDLLAQVIEIAEGKDFFDKLTQALKKPPKYLTNKPFPPEVFLGREDDLNEVHEKLFTGENLLLLVNGSGGTGKTTFVSKYFYTYHEEYTHLAWVFAEKSLLEALLILATPLKLEFDEKMPNEKRLQVLLNAMGELEEPSLLVVDNANELEDLKKYHLALKSNPNFHVLLTTRVTELGQVDIYPLGTLDEVKSKELFTTHYKAHKVEEDDLLEQLLEAIGYNTLVIELLAKNMNNFNNRLKKRYPLVELLDDLNTKGLFGIETKKVSTIYQGQNLEMRQEVPEHIIEAMYELNDLPNTERRLLSVFAVLPAEAIAFDTIEQLISDIENIDEYLLRLANRGWLEYDDEIATFKVSPVIQEVIIKKNGELLWEEVWPIITQLIDLLQRDNIHEENYLYSSVYTRYAVNIIKIALKEDELITLKEGDTLGNIAILCERVGIFNDTTGNLQQAFLYFENFRQLEQSLHDFYPQNVGYKNGLAISYLKLGETYCSLGNLERALEFFEKSTDLIRELYSSFSQNVGFKNGLAISYEKLGETHSSLGNLEKALEYYKEDMLLTKELYSSYPQNVGYKNGLAISYLKLGEAHSSLGNLEKALEYYEDYSLLERELYSSFPQSVDFKNGLAISYEKLGEAHSSLGNLEKTLEYYEDYSRLETELYSSYPQNVGFKNGLAISFSKLGETQSLLGNLEKTLELFEKSTVLIRELYSSYPQNVEFKNNLAISYSKLGETQSLLGNLEKALEYYEDYSLLERELYSSYPQNVGFKNGLAISYEKLGETHSSLGNLEKALEYYEEDILLTKELYSSYPQNVDFKNGLALSYQWIGWHLENKMNKEGKAVIYYKKSKRLLEELTQSFPTYQEFQTNLAWVENRLSKLE